MFHQLASDFRRLLRSFWRVDRIRTSPADGRLLRLQPPCILVVDGRPMEMVARTLVHAAEGTTVSYVCRLGQDEGRLTVPVAGGSTAVVWTTYGVERRLTADQVEVFAGRP